MAAAGPSCVALPSHDSSKQNFKTYSYSVTSTVLIINPQRISIHSSPSNFWKTPQNPETRKFVAEFLVSSSPCFLRDFIAVPFSKTLFASRTDSFQVLHIRSFTVVATIPLIHSMKPKKKQRIQRSRTS